jgi:hypothetical protein
MQRAVLCVVQDEFTALRISERLKSSGFAGSDISVLFPDRSGTRDFAYEQNTKAPEGAAAGGAAGGLLGGLGGWLVGVGALAIPGLGPFVAAGPILAALSGAAAGAALGGVTGALVGMGVPEFEAKQYEGKLRHGNLLISVHTADARQRAVAKEIFEAEGADDVRSVGEAAVDHDDAEDERDRKARRSSESTRP